MFTAPSSVLRSYNDTSPAGHIQEANCHFIHKYPAVSFVVTFNCFLEYLQVKMLAEQFRYWNKNDLQISVTLTL